MVHHDEPHRTTDLLGLLRRAIAVFAGIAYALMAVSAMVLREATGVSLDQIEAEPAPSAEPAS